MENKKFVFVCGLHRSGTSILFKCLREHNEISGFVNTGKAEDEGQHLQTVYKPAYVYGGAGEFGFSDEAHLTESSPLITEANKKKLFNEWSRYWDDSKKVFIEKSPPSLIRTRFLQEMFQNTYFITIIRHPIAVSYATKISLGSKKKLEHLIAHWLYCHDLFLEDSSRLKRSIVIKYEEFVKKPQIMLDHIYSFLDIPKLKNTLTIRSNINFKYNKMWNKMPFYNPIARINKKRIISKFEGEVNRYGYSLRNPDKIEATHNLYTQQK